MELETEFIFETFDEAMKVHKKLFEIIRQNGFVTRADLYCLIYEEDALFPDVFYEYGWINLWGSKVEPCDKYINGNWALKMPKIKKLIIKKERNNHESKNDDKCKQND